MEKTKKDLMSEMAELKVMLNAKPAVASNIPGVISPILSDKTSFQLEKDQIEASKLKPAGVKLLVLDNECDIVDNPLPPFEKTDPRSCELAVDSIDNKVAFCIVFFDGEMCKSLHGAPLQPGCLSVSVDGSIKLDALLPVPIVGEMEKVEEAVGSHVAWPQDLIIFTTDVKKKREMLQSKKDELQRMQIVFDEAKPNQNVPKRFR